MCDKNYEVLFIDKYMENAQSGINFLMGMFDCYVILNELINKYKQYLVQTDSTKNDQQRYQRYIQYIGIINQIINLTKNSHISDSQTNKFLYFGDYLHKWAVGFDGINPQIISFQCKSIKIAYDEQTKTISWGSLWEDSGPGKFVNKFSFTVDHDFNVNDIKLFTDEYILTETYILKTIKLYMIEIKNTVDILEKSILYLKKKRDLLYDQADIPMG